MRGENEREVGEGSAVVCRTEEMIRLLAPYKRRIGAPGWRGGSLLPCENSCSKFRNGLWSGSSVTGSMDPDSIKCRG